MTAPRETDRLIRAFLNEGGTELPDRAFDAVRRDIHQTRQRVVIGPWREPDMSTLSRVAIAAAAVFAVGLAWVNFGPSQSPGVAGRPTPLASASSAAPASPAASASIGQLPSNGGAVIPGRYRMDNYPADLTGPRLVITVPAGWAVDDALVLSKNEASNSGLLISAWQVDGAITDPCTDHTVAKPTARPGPAGIDSLAAALSQQPGTSAKPPAAVTIDGYSGTLVEFTVTADISKCGNGLEGFHIWSSSNGDQRYVQDNAETNRIWILDVEGTRFTFFARIPARVTAADRAELEAMIQTIEIEPARP